MFFRRPQTPSATEALAAPPSPAPLFKTPDPEVQQNFHLPGGLPDIKMPNLPGLSPGLPGRTPSPGLPKLPNLPNLPNLPGWPQIPGISPAPKTPSRGHSPIPNLPNLPHLPGLEPEPVGKKPKMPKKPRRGLRRRPRSRKPLKVKLPVDAPVGAMGITGASVDTPVKVKVSKRAKVTSMASKAWVTTKLKLKGAKKGAKAVKKPATGPRIALLETDVPVAVVPPRL